MAVLFLLPLLLEIPKQRDQIVTIFAYDPDSIGPKANSLSLALTLLQQFPLCQICLVGSPILPDATATGPDRLFPLRGCSMKHQGVYATGRTH